MNIMLLGSTGYLGGNIASYLVKQGHNVFCIVRQSSDINFLKNLGVRIVFSEWDQIEQVFMREKIDWVVNSVCTRESTPDKYRNIFDSNMFFPLNVLSLAIKYKVENYVTMGTGLPIEFNIYSFSKTKFSEIGEFLSKVNNINFVELRLEMLYGGKNEPENCFIKNCCQKLIRNDPLLLTAGNQKRDIIRVEDVTEIIGILLKSNYVKGYQTLSVGSGEQHSIREIVTYMKQIMNSNSDLQFGKIAARLGEPDTLADISWLKNIGYELQYTYFEGLKEECVREMANWNNR